MKIRDIRDRQIERSRERARSYTRTRKAAHDEIWQLPINNEGTTFKEYLGTLPDEYQSAIQEVIYKLLYADNWNRKEYLAALKEVLKTPSTNGVSDLLSGDTRINVLIAGVDHISERANRLHGTEIYRS